MARGEREQLHHVGRAAAAPFVARHRDTVDHDGEPAEEPDPAVAEQHWLPPPDPPRDLDTSQEGEGEHPELVAADETGRLPEVFRERQRRPVVEHERRAVAERSHEPIEQRDVGEELQVTSVAAEEDEWRSAHDGEKAQALRRGCRAAEGPGEQKRDRRPEVGPHEEQQADGRHPHEPSPRRLGGEQEQHARRESERRERRVAFVRVVRDDHALRGEETRGEHPRARAAEPSRQKRGEEERRETPDDVGPTRREEARSPELGQSKNVER